MQHKSTLTGKVYEPSQCVYIYNMVQVARYMKHGVQPVDMFVSNDELCAVFTKNETYELYKAWLKRELT